MATNLGTRAILTCKLKSKLKPRKKTFPVLLNILLPCHVDAFHFKETTWLPVKLTVEPCPVILSIIEALDIPLRTTNIEQKGIS